MIISSKFKNETKLDKSLLVLSFISLSVYALYSIYGIMLDYPFWLDEIFSVIVAGSSFDRMVEILARENNPPLYFLLLRWWGDLFGLSATSTRLSSVLCITIAILFLFRLRKIVPQRFFLLLLLAFVSNPYTIYFAQETRTYAFSMMLVTIGLVLLAERKTYSLIFTCVVLGLTHAYGTAVGAIYLAWMFFSYPKHMITERVVAVAAGLLLTAWPIYHITIGYGSKIIGGNFWIVTEASDTWLSALVSVFPAMSGIVFWPKVGSYLSQEVVTAVCMVWIDAMLLYFVFWWRKNKQQQPTSMRILALAATVTFATLVVMLTIIGLHTPIAHAKYFSIAVPLGAVLTALLFYPLLCGTRTPKIVGTTLLCLYLGVTVVTTHFLIQQKIHINPVIYNWVPKFRKAASNLGDRVFFYDGDTTIALSPQPMFQYYYPEIEFYKTLSFDDVEAFAKNVQCTRNQKLTTNASITGKCPTSLIPTSQPSLIVFFGQCYVRTKMQKVFRQHGLHDNAINQVWYDADTFHEQNNHKTPQEQEELSKKQGCFGYIEINPLGGIE